ncbi:MAG: S-adenosylmethionine:tRNA ribosyltransferase-isomerase, partial [Muribaculaceae bacterium]|nr:S-adenosylmethionine:tRNA ribosyltransferase-isomerase [Muribaculaceae bacterium]
LQTLSRWFESNGIEVLTASTSIMIAPGFHWRIVDGIVTNFHQPQSTLLLLVSSFIDRQTSIDKQASSKTNASDGATTSEWHQKNANDNLPKPECQQKENSFCETTSEWRQEDADDNLSNPESQQKDNSDNMESPECESSNDTTLECQQQDNSDNKAKPEWRKMYDQALANDYRFLSYGDSSLLTTW